MASPADPYRTLGLAPGASLNEIRSAYRRLAKQYHPDAAGDRALPRFLAIQAAYERLVDGEGRLRPAAGRGGARRGADQGEPWRADPARARASREAWRARRAGSDAGSGASASESAGASASGSAGASATGPAGATGGARGASARPRPNAGSAAGTGQAGTSGPAADHGPRERSGRRGPRKATPGSTTYDEAREGPRDPEWEGGSWYGPSSRTYWTINPREYADPRKHGPEYQARARRAVEQEGAAADGRTWAGADGPDAPDPDGPKADVHAGGAAPGPPIGADEPGGERARWGWAGDASTTTDGGSARWGAHGWTYEATAEQGTRTQPGERRWAGDPDRPRPDARAGHAGDGRRDRAATAGTAGYPGDEPDPLPDLEAVARRAAPRHLLSLALRPDRRWRLVLALVGWPPIGYAVGTLLATVTGCATFSAACPEPMPMLPTVVQPLVIAGLILLPPAAAVAAFASIVGLAVAVPVAAVLSVGTLPDSRVGEPVLGVAVAVAYLVALVTGAIAVWRPAPPREAGPADGR